MSTASQVAIALAIIAIVGLVGFMAWREMRTRRLRRQFGPEYERALSRHGNRTVAERELVARERHRHQLDIRPLDPAARERYREQWTDLQERFVDSPRPAVEQADRLVTTVMADRGYPTRDYGEKTATLSVDHARTLDHYRHGHAIGTRAAAEEISTEDLRQAMVHYRALFEDLLDMPRDARGPKSAPMPGDGRGPRGGLAGRGPTARTGEGETDRRVAGGEDLRGPADRRPRRRL